MFKNDVCIHHIAQRGSPTAHIGCSMLYPTTLPCQLLKNHLLLQTSCPQNNNYILIHRSFVFLALFNFHITLWNQHDHYASSLNATTPTTADTYFVAIFLSHYSPFLNDLLLNTPPPPSRWYVYNYYFKNYLYTLIHTYIHPTPWKRNHQKVDIFQQIFFHIFYLFKRMIFQQIFFHTHRLGIESWIKWLRDSNIYHLYHIMLVFFLFFLSNVNYTTSSNH